MRANGFTLIEMLTALFITVILVVSVVPSWRHLSARMRVSTQINALLGNLRYARMEAVKRSRRVVICQSADQQHCAHGDEWDKGWIVFADVQTGGTIRRDPGDPILLHHPRSARTTTLTANRRFFRLDPIGSTTNGTFKICSRKGMAEPRALIISRVGRMRVSKRDPYGDPLPCP